MALCVSEDLMMTFFILFAMVGVMCASESVHRSPESSFESCDAAADAQGRKVLTFSWAILRTDTFPYMRSKRFSVGDVNTYVCYGQHAVDEEGVCFVQMENECMTISVGRGSVEVRYDHIKAFRNSVGLFKKALDSSPPEDDLDIVCLCSCDEEGIALRRFERRSQNPFYRHFIGAKMQYAHFTQPEFIHGLVSDKGDVLEEVPSPAFLPEK